MRPCVSSACLFAFRENAIAASRRKTHVLDETLCLISLPFCVPRKRNRRFAPQDSRLG
jgi:hypothetical protein